MAQTQLYKFSPEVLDGVIIADASIEKTRVGIYSYSPYLLENNIWLYPGESAEPFLAQGWKLASITGPDADGFSIRKSIQSPRSVKKVYPDFHNIPLYNRFEGLSAVHACDEEYYLTELAPVKSVSSKTYSFTRKPRRKRQGRKAGPVRVMCVSPDFEYSDSFRKADRMDSSNSEQPTPSLSLANFNVSILRRSLMEKRRNSGISNSRFPTELVDLAHFTSDFTHQINLTNFDFTDEVQDAANAANLDGSIFTMIQAKLSTLHPRPVECATCLAGFIAWISLTIKRAREIESYRSGSSVFELTCHLTIGMALISEFYHLLKDTEVNVSLPVLDEFMKSCRDTFYGLFDLVQIAGKASLGVRCASGIGFVLCKLFGIPTRDLIDFQGFLRGASELEDMADGLLWHFCEIDITGKRMLDNSTDKLVEEAIKIMETPTEEFHGMKLQEASKWVESANIIVKQIDKSKYPSLTAALATIQQKVVQAKHAQYGANMLRPAPVVVYFHGHEGSGKSHYINTYLIPYLAKICGTKDTRLYNLNTGKHSARYEGQIWGFFDEIGAAKSDQDSHVMANLNNICSGYHAAIPGAGVDEKHQSASFYGVFFASNLDPISIDVGLNEKAKKAFMSRVIKCEVALDGWNPAAAREEQHRCPDFSNVKFTVELSPTNKATFNGEKMAAYVADQLRSKQESFKVSQTTAVPAGLKQEFSLARPINMLTREPVPLPPTDATGHMIRAEDVLNPVNDVLRPINTGLNEALYDANAFLNSMDQFGQDVVEATSPRTLWIFGPAGNGKTTRVTGMIKEYADMVQMPVYIEREYADFPVSRTPAFYILDDVVQPDTKEGQLAFSKFYDDVIHPSGSTAIVFSNYGPYPYLFDSMFAPLKFLKNVFYDESVKRVLTHSFGRRSGFVPTESTSVLELKSTLSCTDFFTKETDDIRNMVFARLSGVGGMNPLRIKYEPISEIPFPQTEADLWLDLGENLTHQAMVRNMMNACSFRIVRCIESLVHLDSPDVGAIIATYRETIKKVPDLKIRVKRGNCLIVASGGDVTIDVGAVLPDLEPIPGGGVKLKGLLANLDISKELYVSFISKNVKATTQLEIRKISELSRCQTLDDTFIFRMGEMMGLTAIEYYKATTKRNTMILGAALTGLAGLGILGVVVWGIRKFCFTQEDDVERKMNSIKAIKRVRNKGSDKWQLCSEDNDGLPAYLEKDYLNFQNHMYQNDLGTIEEIDGKKFSKFKFKSGKRHVWAELNLTDGNVEFSDFNDQHQAAHLPGVMTFKTPAMNTLAESLKQNVVMMVDDEGLGWCYGVMVSDTIGVTVAHAYEKNITCISYEWGGKIVKKPIVKIAEYKQYEQTYFRIADVTPGPFKSLHKYIPTINQLSRATLATMLCYSESNIHFFTNAYSVEASINTKFDKESIKHWKNNIGYIFYGASVSPTTKGSCGLPVFCEIAGVPYFAGIHVVDRKTSNRIGSAVITTEVWGFVQEKLKKMAGKDKVESLIPSITEQNDVIQVKTDVSMGYAKDDTFKAKHPSCDDTYLPLEILQHIKPLDLEHDFQPHGPGCNAIGHFEKGTPADTHSIKYEIGARINETPPFPNAKVPTLPAHEIIARYPDKIPKDKRGVPVVGYARLQTSNNNYFKKSMPLISETEAAAWGKELFSEHGYNAKKIEPLSLQEAVAGRTGTTPIKRDASNGAVLDGIFHSQGKGSLVDYDDSTRELLFPKGTLIEKWIVDQWEWAGICKRLHFPCTLGLKTENLPEEKLWKKRVFAVTSTVSWINQKRILQPLQERLCSNGPKSRFTLVMDPIKEADAWVQEFAGPGGKFAAFDWSSFDFSVPGSVVELAAIALAQGYLRRGEKEPPKKLKNILVTLLKDMTFSSATYDKSVLVFEGGIRSGMADTSLTDSVIAIMILYLEFSRNVFRGMKPFEFFRDIRTRGGGDDLVIAVALDLAVKINLGDVCARIQQNYGMKLTIDTKTDDTPEWVEFTDISFLSRTFIPHPHHEQVWLSKLKASSVASSLYYSESADPVVHLDTVVNSAAEVFPYGQEKYEQYRDYGYALANLHATSIDIPTYAACSDTLWTNIVTNEPIVTHERLPHISPKRNNLEPLTLEMSVSQTRSYDYIKSMFIVEMKRSGSFMEFRTTQAYSDFLEAAQRKESKEAFYQPLKIGNNKVMIFPRNSHAFWLYAEMRMNLTKPGCPGALFEDAAHSAHIMRIGDAVINSWRKMFRNEKARGTMKDIYHPPGPPCGPKKLQNYRIHLVPYLQLLGRSETPNTWKYTKLWALNTLMFEEQAMYDAAEALTQLVDRIPESVPMEIDDVQSRSEPMEVDEVQSDTDGGMTPIAAASTISSSNIDGGAQQQFAADANAALVQTAEMPPAVAGGSGSQSAAVLESLGGYTPETLPRGAFVNTLLAPVYQECPLSTINVGVDTAENTLLWQKDINPWDASFTGPYIHAWASLHDRFAGSFELSLKVSSAGTILGRIALYYVPGDMTLPDTPTRQSMLPFEHVIIDLQQPSSQSLIIRPSNKTDFYMSKGHTSNRGQIVILCYTSIANTYGASVMPPVFPTIKLGPDAMFALPSLSTKAPTAGSKAIPPMPMLTGSSFFFTDGKNLPIKPVDSYQMPIGRSANRYSANHCLSGGVLRTSNFPPQSTDENTLAFRWGAWMSNPYNDGDFATQAAKYGTSTDREGEARHFTPGYDTSDPIDTMVTMSVPWNYGRNKPAPNEIQGLLNAFTHNVSVGIADTFISESRAEYLLTGVKSNNAEAAFAWIEPGNQVTSPIPIQPTYNNSLATFVHEKVGVSSTELFNADRFKVVLNSVSINVGANSNAGANAIKHNMLYKNFTADRACVCRTSFPSNGGDIPPGYRLLMWYQDDVEVFPFGLSGVLPGVKGPTHAPTAGWMTTWQQGIQYLDTNNLMSYTARGSTANGQNLLYVLINRHGIWTFDTPEYGLAVSANGVFSWFLEGTDTSKEWPILRTSSPEIFQSRLAGAPANDDVQMMAMAGGLMAGMGTGLSNFQNHQWDMQKLNLNLNTQKEMQGKALENARTLTAMNNATARGVAVQQGQNSLNVTNARIAGSNPIRLAASQTGATPPIQDGTQAIQAAKLNTNNGVVPGSNRLR